MWLVTTTHLRHGDLGISCGMFLKTWIRSRNVCSAVYAASIAWAPLGGISGDVYHISIVLFCRYANHICVSYTVRTNYGDKCDCHRVYVCHLYLGKAFIWWGMYRTSMLSWSRICMCINKMNFGNHLIQRKLKPQETWNRFKSKIVHCKFYLQLVIASSFEIRILSFTTL
jgi:hypothetical protein